MIARQSYNQHPKKKPRRSEGTRKGRLTGSEAAPPVHNTETFCSARLFSLTANERSAADRVSAQQARQAARPGTMCDKERQAVIVGVGRFTQSKLLPVDQCTTPVGMMKKAAELAARDATASCGGAALLRDAVAVAAPGMFFEQRWRGVFKKKPFANYPRSVADAVGAKPAAEFCVQSFPGGNGPQFLVSTFAEMIANGAVPQGQWREAVGVEHARTRGPAHRPFLIPPWAFSVGVARAAKIY